MSCNCTKCNPNKCGCYDTALTNPCSYTDCGTGSERCTESMGAECVVWTGPLTEVETVGGDTFTISEGERLEQVLQRMMLALVDGVTSCTASNQFHSPWNVYFGTVTANTIQILWASEDINTDTIEIEMDTAIAPSGWVVQGTVFPGVYSFTIPNLVPNTGYKFRLKATSSSAEVCRGVVVYKATLQ